MSKYEIDMIGFAIVSILITIFSTVALNRMREQLRREREYRDHHDQGQNKLKK